MAVKTGLRTPMSFLPVRMREASRLLQCLGLLIVVAVLLFAVNLGGPVGPNLLLWLPIPVGAALLVAVYWRVSRTASLPQPTRRFWRSLAVAAFLVGVGCTAQAVDVLTSTDLSAMHTGPVMLTADLTAVMVIVYALYRLPIGHQGSGAMLRIGLDASTVMLATALFIWHFQTRRAVGTDDPTALIGSLILTVVALVAVFAVAKVVLSRYPFIDNSALQRLGTAMAVGAIGPLLQPAVATIQPYLFPDQIAMPVVLFLAAWAGERQRAVQFGRRRGAVQTPRRTSFSVLPYLAVAAVDALLVAFTWQYGMSVRMIVAAVVLLTGLVVLRQITAFRDNDRLVARLDHGATHDALTQLPNRALFGDRLDKALTSPGDRPVSVALIDLDDFKEVNDTLGHEIGDLLLIGVAQRLNACVRVEDTVARLGGDEFVVVLDGADPVAADQAAERMLAALRKPVIAEGHELPIRASIGIADGRTGDDPSQLLRHADIAMYAAKNVAGSAYLHYDGGMSSAVNEHASLGAELRDAIADDQLFLLYQPIVALDGGRITGVEALVRWTHPTRGMLAPDAFIPVAERTGLIVPVGRWVFREACRQIAAWTAEHGDAAPAVLNVNVSARELREPGYADEVAAALLEFDVTPDRIAVEITETTIFELGASVDNLVALRALGIRIALDDFGTGHSTLTLLQDCPVDELKLDRSFTQAESNGNPTIAAAVIHLAQALGLHVVAEGVETPEQADQLRSLGYEAAQGFYFARPMPADRLGEALRDSRTLHPVPTPAPVTGPPPLHDARLSA
jgi:diguanylate cyclase (GGDEF)-like protein